MYVGGTFALTGAYAEDSAAVLAGFQDYVKYVNDNHILAPWATDKVIPANITFELLWGDDALAPDKTLTIYDDLKSKGLLVERVSGSPEGMALKDRLVQGPCWRHQPVHLAGLHQPGRQHLHQRSHLHRRDGGHRPVVPEELDRHHPQAARRLS